MACLHSADLTIQKDHLHPICTPFAQFVCTTLNKTHYIQLIHIPKVLVSIVFANQLPITKFSSQVAHTLELGN